MTVTVDQFLNAALDRETDAQEATRACRTYFDLVRDHAFFQRTLTQRERARGDMAAEDEAWLKARAALAQVEVNLREIEQAYGLPSSV